MFPHTTDADGAVRLDKWLWAARFFKTRSLAKQAIENGHVRYGGERCKVSKEVALGARLLIRQGWDEIEVTVRGLSAVRGGAPQARLWAGGGGRHIVLAHKCAVLVGWGAGRAAGAPVGRRRW